jgi:hypothetical protein
MAETTGFEPVVGVTYNDLANRRFQPLSHVSAKNRIFHSSRQANFVKASRIESFVFNIISLTLLTDKKTIAT